MQRIIIPSLLSILFLSGCPNGQELMFVEGACLEQFASAGLDEEHEAHAYFEEETQRLFLSSLDVGETVEFGTLSADTLASIDPLDIIMDILEGGVVGVGTDVANKVCHKEEIEDDTRFTADFDVISELCTNYCFFDTHGFSTTIDLESGAISFTGIEPTTID